MIVLDASAGFAMVRGTADGNGPRQLLCEGEGSAAFDLYATEIANTL